MTVLKREPLNKDKPEKEQTGNNSEHDKFEKGQF